MKKGLIGSFQLGALSGIRDAIKIAEKLTGEEGCNIDAIFYASAFQAGIEQFFIPQIPDEEIHSSEFIAKRTKIIAEEKDLEFYKRTNDALSQFLPDNWQKNIEFSSVWGLQSFLCDLFLAMEKKSSLLIISRWPNIEKLEILLPSEFLVPFNNLLSSIEEISVRSPIPRYALDREHAQKYQKIFSADLFHHYSEAQSELDDASISHEKSIPNIVEIGKTIFRSNPTVLQVRKSLVGIVNVTPKLIDAAFGKLPGALAEMAGNLGVNYLEERRRLVIYDFHNAMFELMLKNLVRMVKAADEKNS